MFYFHLYTFYWSMSYTMYIISYCFLIYFPFSLFFCPAKRECANEKGRYDAIDRNIEVVRNLCHNEISDRSGSYKKIRREIYVRHCRGHTKRIEIRRYRYERLSSFPELLVDRRSNLNFSDSLNGLALL